MSTITVSRKELQDAVTFASLGLAKRPILPVLAGMRLTVTAGTLELAAFDYETATAITVHGESDGYAQVLANGGELAAAVKTLPRGKNVTAALDVTGDTLTITCEGIEASVSLLPLHEYPQLPPLPAQSGAADGEAFARSVTRVSACAGTDDTLPVLLCVQFSSDGTDLGMAATDRYRLAVDSLHWTGPDDITALVPAAILVKYAKAADKSGKVSLHFGEGFAGFSDGIRTLITHTNQGEFPRSVRSFIRTASDADATILADAKALHDAVARADKLTERNMPIGFDVTAGRITVTAERDGKPVGTQHVPAELDGPDQEYRFNGGYLASVLAGFDGPVWVNLKAKTETVTNYAGVKSEKTSQQPAVITADGDTFTAIIMPIRQPQ